MSDDDVSQTIVASTLAAFVECGHSSLAWSECDDDPYFQDYVDEPYDDVEPSSRWVWAVVIGAWAAALAVVVGVVFVAFTQQQQQPTTPPPHSVSSVPSPNGGTIVAPTSPDLEPPQNT